EDRAVAAMLVDQPVQRVATEAAALRALDADHRQFAEQVRERGADRALSRHILRRRQQTAAPPMRPAIAQNAASLGSHANQKKKFCNPPPPASPITKPRPPPMTLNLTQSIVASARHHRVRTLAPCALGPKV